MLPLMRVSDELYARCSSVRAPRHAAARVQQRARYYFAVTLS